MATLAIKGNIERTEDIRKLFMDLGAEKISFLSFHGDYLFYIGDKKEVQTIPDQPENIYRNLLFNVYTIEEFNSQFPFRPGDKVAISVYESSAEPVSIKILAVKNMSWDTERGDICYTIEGGYNRGVSHLRKAEPKCPKDGDVVTYFHDDKPTVYIYKSGHKYNTSFYAAYSSLREQCFLCTGGHLDRNRSDIRPATEVEKKLLFDKLAEIGLAWDAEKRELVKLKWKPVLGEVYFRVEFVDHEFRYADWNWKNSTYEIEAYERGWCFKTKEECQVFCDKLNQAIKAIIV